MPDKTLGDWVLQAYDKYIKPTPTKESKLTSRNKWSNELNKTSDDEKLTPKKRRKLAHQSPIFMKGVKKKSMDSIRAWFEIITDNDTNPISADVDAINAFEKRTNYRAKFAQAAIDSHIYGDGFLLITFDDKDKDIDISKPVAPGAEPRQVTVINPEKIVDSTYATEMDELLDRPSFVFSDDGSTRKVIHYSRIQHIKINSVSHNVFGLSTVDLLRNTIKSKKNVDIAVGRILAWFSHGILDIKTEGMNDDEVEELKKVAKKHPTAWVRDEDDFDIEIHNPRAIDPKPFMDFLVLNIASALVMPVHVLTGIQVGKVTGAEIGFADYYRDIKDIQTLTYTPLIENLYKQIIEARGRKWKYSLQWNTVYVDEMGEANLIKTRMEAVEKGVNTNTIERDEARKMINEGAVKIDPKRKPENPNKKRPTPPQLPKEDAE